MQRTAQKGSSGRAATAAALGGLLFGFDTAVIAGVTQALTDSFDLTSTGLGAAVSAALVGTLVGALGAGKPSDRHGSRVVPTGCRQSPRG